MVDKHGSSAKIRNVNNCGTTVTNGIGKATVTNGNGGTTVTNGKVRTNVTNGSGKHAKEEVAAAKVKLNTKASAWPEFFRPYARLSRWVNTTGECSNYDHVAFKYKIST